MTCHCEKNGQRGDTMGYFTSDLLKQRFDNREEQLFSIYLTLLCLHSQRLLGKEHWWCQVI